MDKDLNVYGTTGMFVEIPILGGFGKKLPKLCTRVESRQYNR
jgi:hypothetical protein